MLSSDLSPTLSPVSTPPPQASSRAALRRSSRHSSHASSSPGSASDADADADADSESESGASHLTPGSRTLDLPTGQRTDSEYNQSNAELSEQEEEEDAQEQAPKPTSTKRKAARPISHALALARARRIQAQRDAELEYWKAWPFDSVEATQRHDLYTSHYSHAPDLLPEANLISALRSHAGQYYAVRNQLHPSPLVSLAASLPIDTSDPHTVASTSAAAQTWDLLASRSFWSFPVPTGSQPPHQPVPNMPRNRRGLPGSGDGLTQYQRYLIRLNRCSAEMKE